MRVDTVIDDAIVVTMDARGTVFRGWIALADGLIAATGTGAAPESGTRIDAAGAIVHPGFVSAHTHTMDTLARGALDRAQPFFSWLFGTYYGAVLALDADGAAVAARAAAEDLARAGVTTVLDCWGVGDVGSARADAALAATVSAARESGLRWIVAPMVADRLPPEWEGELRAAERAGGFRRDALTADTATALAFARGALALAADRVAVWTCVELPEMATDDLLRGLRDLGAPGFTTHLCASEAGAAGIPDPQGAPERAVARLERLGLLDASMLGAHLTFTTREERAMLAAHGCGAAHCAAATMFGGGGRSALGELRESGVRVGLGLDNGSLNARADMAGEMRFALAFDRGAGSGGNRVAAAEMLAHATIDAARALGIAERTGSLEVGKDADLVLLDPARWRGRTSPDADIVLQGRPEEIRLVLAGGRRVFER